MSSLTKNEIILAGQIAAGAYEDARGEVSQVDGYTVVGHEAHWAGFNAVAYKSVSTGEIYIGYKD